MAGLARPWQPPPEVETEREAEGWDVIERPAIPTPAQTDELRHWERSHRLEPGGASHGRSLWPSSGE